MNADLQEQIVSLVESAKEAGKDTAQFIQQQAPDVVQQLVRWKIAEGILMLLGGVALFGVAKVISRWIKKHLDDETWDEHPEIVVPGGIGFVLAATFGAMMFCEGAVQTTKAVVAPKVLILETVASLVKK